MKHVIIGGVAGGATASARIRRADELAEIILIEKGEHISYANCGLPYYLGGVITEYEKLFLQTPASFGKRFNVDVRVENEVIQVDPKSKQVKIRRKDGSEYTESYDKLLLSPGATPIIPNIAGIDSDGIFTLRNVSDMDRIKSYIESNSIKNVVVVGGGFIGLEMAENMHTIGAEVSIVEMADQVMAPVDYSTAAHVHQHIIQHGVKLFLKHGVVSFERKDGVINVELSNGNILNADLVILSIGVKPLVELAKNAGIKSGETGGIWVSEYLETSEKDIYAVGDAIEYPHPLTGKPWLNLLANPANRQGRIVADNMVYGNSVNYEGAIGTGIAKVFDLTVASTGLAAKHLTKMGIPYMTSVTHSGSHAGYYPQSMPLTIRLTYDPKNGKLYGGQCVGTAGVDKRIDQIALVIKNNGTIYDLIKIEHSYAPPFSSAKDPVAIAGYVASNVVSGAMPVVEWTDVCSLDTTKTTLLDVRTEDECSLGMIPGAINIPLDELRDRYSELSPDRPIYIYCAIGLRGYLALRILTARGFKDVYNLTGGYKTYITSMSPVCDESNGANNNNAITANNMNKETEVIKVDACGLQCPGPILKMKQTIDSMKTGQRLEMIANDAGFSRDAQAWCKSTGNILINNTISKGLYTVVIEKAGDANHAPIQCSNSHVETLRSDTTRSTANGKTFIMFSDDLDKAIATFILANGAAAMGGSTTIFFTFWGLNVIKKVNKPTVKKDVFGKMFSVMLASNSSKLKLSKMSMGGIGGRMMRHIMKKKGVESLESLREQALAQGVEFIACQMSMDVMGVKVEELLDGVTVGGVATYMERADGANVNLFI